MKFAFFGGEPLAVPVLEELKQFNLLPSLIICNPDRPSGRGQKLTPPPAKVWAEQEGIEVFQPDNYKDSAAEAKLADERWDLFVVVAYNFILPNWLLDLPTKGTLNVHPSLLPRLRGASPIRTAILENLPEEIGVTIMLLDEKMDHGPILEQVPLEMSADNWPMSGPELDNALAKLGGSLLANTITDWVNDDVSPQDQDHEQATYCTKLDPAKRELKINPTKLPVGPEAKQVWHTICAFAGVGDTYFIYDDKRVKVKQAMWTDGGSLVLKRVIPEGKKEIDFKDYLNSLK
jgi:methionyl-tRNA formyltransferase